MIIKSICFRYKKKGHTAYDYLKKRKIVAISEDMYRYSDSQKKSSFFEYSGKKTLFVLLLFMSRNLFYKSLFIIQYTLGNIIKIITLVNTYIIGFAFIDKKFPEIIYKSFKPNLTLRSDKTKANIRI